MCVEIYFRGEVGDEDGDFADEDAGVEVDIWLGWEKLASACRLVMMRNALAEPMCIGGRFGNLRQATETFAGVEDVS